MKRTLKGITAPRGFKANGIACGIKSSGDRDLSLVFSEVPAKACGLFTSNKFKAAPVVVTREHLNKNNRAQAIIINSGNANACTGKRGIDDARHLTKVLSKALRVREEDVLVASTGIIGKTLPLKRIIKGIPELIEGLCRDNGNQAALGIMTTDSLPKETSKTVMIGAHPVNIGGMAKGAGMIHPHLATCLTFFSTDCLIEYRALKEAFRGAIENSFNCITVDGERSTNDMALILANGLAKNPKIGYKEKGYRKFAETLKEVSLTLAKMVVEDAEGAEKLLEVNVRRADSIEDAKEIAFKVANSPLVKTALHGGEPNWGRIVASIGASTVNFRPEKLDLYLGSHLVFSKKEPQKVRKGILRRIFESRKVRITIDLNSGEINTTVYTSDLSEQYVRLNAEYRG